MKKLTPLHCAAHMGRVDLVRLLAPIANVNKIGQHSKDPPSLGRREGVFSGDTRAVGAWSTSEY